MATSNQPFSGGAPVIMYTASAIGSEFSILTAPGAGAKWRLTGMAIALSASASIIVREDTAGGIIFVVPLLAANTPFIIDLGSGIVQSVANKPITMTSSVAANLSGTFFGRVESAP